jgi:hypothetical protein
VQANVSFLVKLTHDIPASFSTDEIVFAAEKPAPAMDKPTGRSASPRFSYYVIFMGVVRDKN